MHFLGKSFIGTRMFFKGNLA